MARRSIDVSTIRSLRIAALMHIQILSKSTCLEEKYVLTLSENFSPLSLKVGYTLMYISRASSVR